MKVLLLAMPDITHMMDYAARLPNLGLTSIAGNMKGHEVKVLDLIVFRPRVRKELEETIRSFRPQLVGLSAMSFQFDTLVRVARFIRAIDPAVRIAAGGYHATLMFRKLTENSDRLPLDFIVRGEGEKTFAELANQLDRPNPDFAAVAGLSFRNADGWRHNEDRPLLDLEILALPDRKARLVNSFSILDMPADVAETSRGCPMNCTFCSITHMYGRTFRKYSTERIVEDLRNIRRAGAKAVFFVDDNITHDIEHFRGVCEAVARNGLNDLWYMVQVAAAGIAGNPDVAEAMDRANFRAAFVGFESMLPQTLKQVNKATNPEINRRAAAILRSNNIAVIATFIAGYPDDTRESVRENYRLVRRLKPDAIIAQFMTPYPKTVVREEMLQQGLVENIDDFSAYDGFTCNVRTKYLSSKELHHALRRETLMAHFDASLIRANYFLRRHLGAFLRVAAKQIANDGHSILKGRSINSAMDI